jgi:hypothetical protein
MAKKHWLTVQFDEPKSDPLDKQHYKSYYKGYVAYHDSTPGNGGQKHDVDCEWYDNDHTLHVMIEDLDDHPPIPRQTYHTTAVSRIYSGVDASDPPAPPAPPPPR